MEPCSQVHRQISQLGPEQGLWNAGIGALQIRGAEEKQKKKMQSRIADL